MSSADHTFGQLLRHAAPLVMAPPGPLPPVGPQLRGVVRSGTDRARVLYCPDARMNRGFGFEFELSSNGQELNVDAAIDWLRTVIPATGSPHSPFGASPVTDSHDNLVVAAADAGFSASRDGPWYDQNLFSILSILIHGGGFPWFEDVYSCTGFLLRENKRCRFYVRSEPGGDIYGLDVPLVSPDGRVRPGMGGNFPQELASIIRTQHILAQPRISAFDDYASLVFDLTDWAI